MESAQKYFEGFVKRYPMYSYILRLDDWGLKDIDPYERNISDDLKVRIFDECRTNFWYFLRMVFRFKDAGCVPGQYRSFIPTKATIESAAKLVLGRDCISIGAAQCGKSIIDTAFVLWLKYFTTKTIVFTSDRDHMPSINHEKEYELSKFLPDYITRSPKSTIMIRSMDKTLDEEFLDEIGDDVYISIDMTGTIIEHLGVLDVDFGDKNVFMHMMIRTTTRFNDLDSNMYFLNDIKHVDTVSQYLLINIIADIKALHGNSGIEAIKDVFINTMSGTNGKQIATLGYIPNFRKEIL